MITAQGTCLYNAGDVKIGRADLVPIIIGIAAACRELDHNHGRHVCYLPIYTKTEGANMSRSMNRNQSAFATRDQRACEGAQYEVSHALRSYRESIAKQTQEDFAASLGISRGTLQHMESGDGGVAMSTWLRVWHRMGVLADVRAAAVPQRELHVARMDDLAADVERAHARRAAEQERKAAGVTS